MFYVVQLSYVQCCCITQYLRGLRKQFELLPGSGASGLKAKRLLEVYRQLQILVQYYNQIQQDVCIIAFLAFSGFAGVLSAFALIKNGSHLTMLELNLFICILIDGIAVIVVIFGAFGRLDSESEETLTFLRTRFLADYVDAKLNVKQIRRFVLSLTPLQVNFGSVNHIDRLTPMTSMDLCIDQLQSLLLCS
jgi:hypothetical protein